MNKNIELLKRQLIHLLREKHYKANLLIFDSFKNLIKVKYDNKFITYLESQEFSDRKNFKELNILRDKTTNKILSLIKKTEKTKNIYCIVLNLAGHNLVDKSIESLKKQTLIPQLLLLVTSEADKKFAINRNVEFIYSKEKSTSMKIQNALNFVKTNYLSNFGIMICSGGELFTKNYIKECFNISHNADIIGSSDDYILNTVDGECYRRIINQIKFRDILPRNFRNKYLLNYGRLLKKNLLDRLKWKIYSDDTDLSLQSFNRICQANPNIGFVTNSHYITVFQDFFFNKFVSQSNKTNNFELVKIENLPSEELSLINRVVIKSPNHTNHLFSKTKKIIKSNNFSKNDENIIEKPKHVKSKIKDKKKLIKKNKYNYKTEKSLEKQVNDKSRINDFFDKVFLINLERDKERLKKVNKELERLNIKYDRLPAIDGTNPVIIKTFRSMRGHRLESPTKYAKLLSHIKALEMSRKLGYQRILILEDDVFFHTDFNKHLNKLFNIPKNWDILYLGHDKTYLKNRYKNTNKNFNLAQGINTSYAYALNKNCYNYVLGLLKKKEYPIEISLKQVQNLNSSYVLTEPIVYTYQTKKKKTVINRNIPNTSFNIDDRISVVLPTYNGFPLIKRCINSIINQTYRNWELIIINDGSTDKKIINYLNSLKNTQIKVYHLKKNIGLPYALNRGIERCKGRYWTWISDDNEFVPECFYFLKEQIDSGYDFVYSNYHFINEIGSKNEEKIKKGNKIKLENYNYRTILTEWRGMPCYLWKMSAVQKIGFFDEDAEGIEDYDFVIRTFIAFNKSTKFLDLSLFKYYRRNNTITTRIADKLDGMKQNIMLRYKNIDYFVKLNSLINNSNNILFYISTDNDTNKLKYITYLNNYFKLFLISPYYKGVSDKEIISINKNLFDEFVGLIKIPTHKNVLIYDNELFYKYKTLLKSYISIFDVKKIDDKKWNHEFKLGVDYSDIVITSYSSINSHLKKTYKPKRIILIEPEYTDIYKFIKKINKGKKNILNIGVVTNCGDKFYLSIIKEILADNFSNCSFTYFFNEKDIDNYLNDVNLILMVGDIINPNDCDGLIWNRKFLKKPIYLFAVGQDNSCGMIDDHEFKKIINFLSHKNVLYITTKDEQTKIILEDHLPANINVIGDLFFLLSLRSSYYNYKNILEKNKIEKDSAGLVLSINCNIEKINSIGNDLIAKNILIDYIELNTEGAVKNIELLNNINFNKRILTGNSIDDIFLHLNNCKVVYTDQYYAEMICLIIGVPVIRIDKNDTLEINKVDKITKNKDDLKNALNKLKKTIINNHFNVIHFGSYWQKDNDIIKLMVDDLSKICKTTEIDLQIYENESRIKKFNNIEPDKANYPNKYIRIIRDDYLREVIDEEKPNIIITNSAGLTFSDEGFELLNSMNIITIGMSMSDPDVFPYNGKIYSQKYDYFFTNSLQSVKTQYSLNTNIDLFPFACSTTLHKPLNVVKKYDIVVVGGCRPDRINTIDKLKEHFSVGVYGSGWPKNYEAIKVNGIQHVQALNRGHIYLSFGLTVAGFTNVKVGLFEAAACKMILVTDKTYEINKYFKEDEEIILYSEVDDLINKLKTVIKDKTLISKLKNNSYNRFLKEHTWEKRWINKFINIL